ncbi:uncharacterized protein C9orf43 homolog isoform X2 [Rhineura floridana]|uniref:uncharacterized protein C9orf43 homolog isoform X2 n=1 Tax=Rhineura floridana TaxID=261503 RepID=UPI002AC8097D|nr:uncharacterized protein C9orf43 homolog isoform X2 [Rhineura floridana]
MVSIDASQWDETICDMIACQHPPCWEAMRRIEKGHPRILLRTLVSPGRDSPESEDELPTLKIVNLPLNYSQRERICAESFGSISKTISNIKDARRYFFNSTLNDALIPAVSGLSSERNPFPGLNSRMESHTPHFTPISFTCLRQAEKIQVTDLGEFAVHRLYTNQPTYGNLVVRWVPDVRHRHQQAEKLAARVVTPARRMCVKDLALESILSFKDKKETRRKKSNKVPTGGQPYLLHLRKRQKVPANKSSPVHKETDPRESLIRQKQFSPSHLLLAPLAPPHVKCLLNLENSREGLWASKENLSPPFTVQKAPSLYRLETKIPVKGKFPRRIPSQLKVALRDSVVFRHLMPTLAKQLDGSDSLCDEGGGLLDKVQLFQEGSAEGGSGGPEMPPVTAAERTPSMKFVEYKSNRATLYMEGCDNFAPRISRMESKYSHYCKHLASRKESLLTQSDPSAVISREPWPQGAAQKTEDTLLQMQSLDPPPPPPSPLIPENSDDPLGLT